MILGLILKHNYREQNRTEQNRTEQNRTEQNLNSYWQLFAFFCVPREKKKDI